MARTHAADACRKPRPSARRAWRLKVRDLIVSLEADGWYRVRMKGSHRQYRHPTKLGTLTVSGHPGIDVPPGTLSSALKQAGLKNPKE
jgi:predicted RNA binding protein YcfA (HicA-like mRNA interferase family)